MNAESERPVIIQSQRGSSGQTSALPPPCLNQRPFKTGLIEWVVWMERGRKGWRVGVELTARLCPLSGSFHSHGRFPFRTWTWSMCLLTEFICWKRSKISNTDSTDLFWTLPSPNSSGKTSKERTKNIHVMIRFTHNSLSNMFVVVVFSSRFHKTRSCYSSCFAAAKINQAKTPHRNISLQFEIIFLLIFSVLSPIQYHILSLLKVMPATCVD